MSTLSLLAMTVLAAALLASSCSQKSGLNFADAPAASPSPVESPAR